MNMANKSAVEKKSDGCLGEAISGHIPDTNQTRPSFPLVDKIIEKFNITETDQKTQIQIYMQCMIMHYWVNIKKKRHAKSEVKLEDVVKQVEEVISTMGSLIGSNTD